LTVHVLHGAFHLPGGALAFALHIASHPPEPFLDLAAKIFCCAVDTISLIMAPPLGAPSREETAARVPSLCGNGFRTSRSESFLISMDLAQSSSAPRFVAGASGFFILSQSVGILSGLNEKELKNIL
jgi:hypothetical protein